MNKNVGKNENEQVVATPVQVTEQAQLPLEAQVQVVQPVQQTEQKENWFKKHWKMLTAGAAGLTAVGISTWQAYKRGKKAGMATVVPVQPQEEQDYSLDPNM